ncbi:lantibiotic dehydratase [Nocardia vaccinii]|uniref:lantibiotic dehydratase n=1 Tax=Nocardia vaccinii TaxID=1822 RepID=UPI00082D1676|nr:lantibiotic dehydratase [Nocardia vaccinii]
MNSGLPDHGGGTFAVPGPVYSARPFFLLRAPALPAETITGLLASSPADVPNRPEQLIDDVLRLWRSGMVSAAVEMASPDLSKALRQFGEHSERDRQRALMSLLRYVNRMSVRATPFGLMAGVATGTFAAQGRPRVVWHDGVLARPRARMDMAWVLHLFQSLTDSSAARSGLRVRTNDLIHQGRGRLWLPTADAYGANTRRSVSVRLSPPVRAVIDLAHTPIALETLRKQLAGQFPSVPADTVTGLLQQLIELDFLMVADRPQLVHSDTYDPLADLASIVDQNAAVALKELATAVDDFNRGDQDSAVMLPPLMAHVAECSRTLSPDYAGHLLQLDARLHTEGPPVLPADVQALAEQAAQTLAAVVGTSFRYPRWLQDYATAFTERYGVQAHVPVLELLSSETGLGPPTGYRNPARSYPLIPETAERHHQARDALLTQLASTALADRCLEIVLDDRWLAAFVETGAATPDERPAIPALDIHFQLSPPGKLADRWMAVLTGMAATFGGRTFARFYDLLDDRTRDGLRELAEAEQAQAGAAELVELAYLPHLGRAVNVAVRPEVRAWELPVNVSPGTPTERRLSLSDIVVGVRSGRLYLWSRSLGCEVLFTQHSMLSLLSGPNVCRFLLEVSSTKYRGIAGFDWGNLEGIASFLPRVRRDRVILRRACWHLRPADLGVADTADDVEFLVALRNWGERWMLPRHVYLTEGDNHIMLDLDSSLSLAELRRALYRGEHEEPVRLEEVLPAPDDGFLTDDLGRSYTAEVVVPVVCTQPPPAARAPISSAIRPIPHSERMRHIGSDWLYVKLYAEPDAHDTLLIDQYIALTSRLTQAHGIDRSFFLRYADPAPHLRVRFCVPYSEQRRACLVAVTEWAHDLVAAGRITEFSFGTYHRETERYGGPAMIDAAECLFCADSTAVAELLRYLADHRGESADSYLPRECLAALSLERIGSILIPDFSRRRTLVRTMASRSAGSGLYRTAAGSLWSQYTGVGPAVDVLRHVGDRWEMEGTCFRSRMDDLDASGSLWSQRENVVRTLLHMHSNRLGLHHEDEDSAYGVWRRLLDRIAACSSAPPTQG